MYIYGSLDNDLACCRIILRDTRILRQRSSSIQLNSASSKSTSCAFLPSPHCRLRDDAPFFFKLANICFCLHHSRILLPSTTHLPSSQRLPCILFFSAFNLKVSSYDFRLDIALTNLCSFATVKCEIDSRHVTNQLSTQTCGSITANSCSGPASIRDRPLFGTGLYSGPGLYKRLVLLTPGSIRATAWW